MCQWLILASSYLTIAVAAMMAQQEMYNVSPIPDDILLTDLDLPDDNKYFFTKMTKMDFHHHFGVRNISGRKVGGKLQRIFITLALEVDNESIPIPFIVDTGAPNEVYLGKGSTEFFQRGGILINDSSRYNAITGSDVKYLKGILHYGNEHITNPSVSNLPQEWLNKAGGDLWKCKRANILGIEALEKLNISISPREISKTLRRA